MSYSRKPKPLEIMEWEVISLVSGKTIAFADSIDEARVLAADYQMNPDLSFIGIDKEGRQAQTWSSSQVLDGTMESELAS